MRDQITQERVNLLHPAIRIHVLNAIDATESKLGSGCAIRVVQGLRTIQEQDHLYQIGRTLKGSNARPGHPMGDIVTNAPGGRSWHNFGLAVDCAILYDLNGDGNFESLSWDMVKDQNKDGEADWQEMVDNFKAEGFEWGGDWQSFKDNPHFEMRFGMVENCSTALAKYEAKEFIPGTEYILV